MSIKQETELLAPAGDIEAGYAALYYGADAVYLGLPKFSARAEAINFTKEQLDEFTAYAHATGKKVYVAFNTLVQESELPQVLESLQMCVETGVDAMIVQDLGVARIIRKSFPSLALHASTQLAVHNLEGALALKKLGFERVVLARELSLNEIKEIKDKCGMEVEVFVHGALCYSYSGLCLFSSLQTTRSANRGKCVYSCRDTFTVDGKKTHPFSMKDLALQKEVLKLKGLSLKIEGRKKNALYVAAVTDYYRRILDTGKEDISLADNIKQIFSRPWTNLHFNGKNRNVTDPDFVGHRGLKIGVVERLYNHVISVRVAQNIAKYDGIQIDIKGTEKPFGFSAETLSINSKKVYEVPAGKVAEITLPDHHPFISKGDAVYLASSTRVKGAYGYDKPKPGAYKNRLPIEVSVFIEQDKAVAYAAGESAEITGDFQPAKDIEKMNEAVKNVFFKTGDTVFELKDLEIANPEGVFIPVSLLNELRRQLYSKIVPVSSTPTLPSIPVNKEPIAPAKWFIKTDNVQSISSINPAEYDEVWVVVDTDFNPNMLNTLDKEKVRISLNPICRAPNKLHTLIDKLWQAGYKKYAIANIGGLSFVPNGADIIVDTFLPMLNTQSIATAGELGAKAVTLSIEDTMDNMKELLASKKVGIIAYQDTPVFISANCVRDNSCAECSHQVWRKDIANSKGKFEIVSKNCLTVVIPKEAFYMENRSELNPLFWRVDFCHKEYTPSEAVRIWQIVRKGEKIRGTQTFNTKKQFA